MIALVILVELYALLHAQAPPPAAIAVIEGPQTGREGELAALTLEEAMKRIGVPGMTRLWRRRCRQQCRDDTRHAVSGRIDQQADRRDGDTEGRLGPAFWTG